MNKYIKLADEFIRDEDLKKGITPELMVKLFAVRLDSLETKECDGNCDTSRSCLNCKRISGLKSPNLVYMGKGLICYKCNSKFCSCPQSPKEPIESLEIQEDRNSAFYGNIAVRESQQDGPIHTVLARKINEIIKRLNELK